MFKASTGNRLDIDLAAEEARVGSSGLLGWARPEARIVQERVRRRLASRPPELTDRLRLPPAAR